MALGGTKIHVMNDLLFLRSNQVDARSVAKSPSTAEDRWFSFRGVCRLKNRVTSDREVPATPESECYCPDKDAQSAPSEEVESLSMEIPQQNLAQISEMISDHVGDRLAIVDGERRLTYSDITGRSRQFARVIRERGVGKDYVDSSVRPLHESRQDHVAIVAANGSEYLEVMLGAFKARAVPVNINYRYVPEELCHILLDCAAKAIVFESAYASIVAAVLSKLPKDIVLIQIDDGSGIELLPPADSYEELLKSVASRPLEWEHRWSPDDLYLLYTGGTTGLPKAALWRQADIFRATLGGRNVASGEPWRSTDELMSAILLDQSPNIVLPCAPFMHGAGQWTAIQTLNLGGTVVIQSDPAHLDARSICRAIDRERVTYLQVIGDAFCRPIMDEVESGSYDLAALRIIRTGGTALSASLKRRILDRLPHVTVMDIMASSEGGRYGIRWDRVGGESRHATFSPSTGTVVLSSDRDRLLRPDDDVEGWLAKSGDIALGYLGDLDKTAETFPTLGGIRYVVPGDKARWPQTAPLKYSGARSPLSTLEAKRSSPRRSRQRSCSIRTSAKY